MATSSPCRRRISFSYSFLFILGFPAEAASPSATSGGGVVTSDPVDLPAFLSLLDSLFLSLLDFLPIGPTPLRENCNAAARLHSVNVRKGLVLVSAPAWALVIGAVAPASATLIIWAPQRSPARAKVTAGQDEGPAGTRRSRPGWCVSRLPRVPTRGTSSPNSGPPATGRYASRPQRPTSSRRERGRGHHGARLIDPSPARSGSGRDRFARRTRERDAC